MNMAKNGQDLVSWNLPSLTLTIAQNSLLLTKNQTSAHQFFFQINFKIFQNKFKIFTKNLLYLLPKSLINHTLTTNNLPRLNIPQSSTSSRSISEKLSLMDINTPRLTKPITNISFSWCWIARWQWIRRRIFTRRIFIRRWNVLKSAVA